MAQVAQRPAKKAAAGGEVAGGHDFPVLFTIDNTNRHEVILINPGFDIAEVKEAMSGRLKSPNCAEVLSKYRNKDSTDEVSEVKVKWGDKPIRCETTLTDDNVEAVLRMMETGGGKDVFNVSVKSKPSGDGAKSKSKSSGDGAKSTSASDGANSKPSGEAAETAEEGDEAAASAAEK